MKIYPIKNYGCNNLKFSGSAPVNVNLRENYKQPEDNNENNNKTTIPEWLRKSTLFGLIAFAVVNDPATQQYFKPESVKQQEKILNEYFEDVSNFGYTNPAHHLNTLADVDKPEIKLGSKGNYNIKLTLDNGKKVEFNVNTSEKNENVLYGYFKSDNGKLLKYKAEFDSRNPERFMVAVRDGQNKKYIFGRKPNGELYKIEKGKKIVLNKENVKRYQDELKEQELLEKFEFFSTKNDMWRKLNLIFLFLWTLNEWGRDTQKRERKNNEK